MLRSGPCHACVTGPQDAESDDMMETALGPLDENERLQHVAPAITAIVPVEDRGRHELLRIAASLAQGLPDVYAQEIWRAAEALGVHPAPMEERLFYSPDIGTLARIGGCGYVLGRLSYLRRLHVEPHKAERDVAEDLERRGNAVFAVVVQHNAHCIGLIAVNLAAAARVAEPYTSSIDVS